MPERRVEAFGMRGRRTARDRGDVRSNEIADQVSSAWASRAGRDPATLLVEGASSFQVREVDCALVITSHVTGSSYELTLPASDETLGRWIDEIVGHDVYTYKQRADRGDTSIRFNPVN